MQDFFIFGYVSMNFTMSTLKLILLLLIPNSVTALTNLLFILNFLKTFPCWYAHIKMLFLLHLVSLSNFLTNSIASFRLFVVIINPSKPFASISSLLISQSNSLCNTWSSVSFDCFLISPKN